MSVFTNATGSSKEESEAYVSAVIELLGERDPFEVLGGMGIYLDRVLRRTSPREMTTPEAPGKWSVRHVMQHMADSELVFAYRIRRILAEDNPVLHLYDQDVWAAGLRYEEVDAQEAVELFSALRRANVRLLRRATAEDLERSGRHEERGAEPLGHMLKLYAGHDLLHQRQIERILRLVTAAI